MDDEEFMKKFIDKIAGDCESSPSGIHCYCCKETYSSNQTPRCCWCGTRKPSQHGPYSGGGFWRYDMPSGFPDDRYVLCETRSSDWTTDPGRFVS